jgi:hypothetical protein
MIGQTTFFLFMTRAVGAFACLALLATSSAGAQAQTSTDVKQKARAFAQTCRADFQRLCAGVRPGGGRGLACLQQHVSEVTPQCQGVLAQAETMRNGGATR